MFKKMNKLIFLKKHYKNNLPPKNVKIRIWASLPVGKFPTRTLLVHNFCEKKKARLRGCGSIFVTWIVINALYLYRVNGKLFYYMSLVDTNEWMMIIFS